MVDGFELMGCINLVKSISRHLRRSNAALTLIDGRLGKRKAGREEKQMARKVGQAEKGNRGRLRPKIILIGQFTVNRGG